MWPSGIKSIFPLHKQFSVQTKIRRLYRSGSEEYTSLGGVPRLALNDLKHTSCFAPCPSVQFIPGRKAIGKSLCKLKRISTNLLVVHKMPNALAASHSKQPQLSVAGLPPQ